MSKFKVGDKVEIVETACCGNKVGDVGKVESVGGDFCHVVVGGRESKLYRFRRLKLAWQPKQGEMIEVFHNEKGWVEREFVMILNGMFLVKYLKMKKGTDQSYFEVKEARPIKTTHTITDSQGRTAEISAASWLEMQKLFNYH